jgi:hypothetical protein
MGEHEVKWLGVKGSWGTRIFGEVGFEEPYAMEINVENLIDHFMTDYPRHLELWERVLEPANLMEVEFARRAGAQEDFVFPSQLWVKIVYDYAVAYNFDCDLSRRELVTSLVPLYCARTADFALRTRNMTSMEAEQLVLRQAEEFEYLKPYLVQKWLKAKESATGEPLDLLPVTG